MGEPPRLFNPHTTALAPSLSNPQVSRADTASHFVWRVRNVPFAEDVFSVAADTTARELVVRTTNRKFFKRLRIPELDAAQVPLAPDAMTWHFVPPATLVVQYAKPHGVLVAEAQEQARAACRGRSA